MSIDTRPAEETSFTEHELDVIRESLSYSIRNIENGADTYESKKRRIEEIQAMMRKATAIKRAQRAERKGGDHR